jgi:DNA helicase-2/ATP-dependent DNA helicase PcrA
LGTGCSDDLEEERRLLYVAMTRAKDQLMLMVPQRFYAHQQSRSGDRHMYAARTRFIPREIASHFELRAWPGSIGAARPGARAGGIAVDLGARMRGMWQRTGS